MIENITISELKIGDILHYNTKDCVRSTGAKHGMPFYSTVKRITGVSQNTLKVKTTVGDEIIYLTTATVQVEREEQGYTLQPYKRPKIFRGVSIE
jgi:hypothetical protein